MSRARRILVIPDYFIFRLTGRGATDPVTAGSTGFYDLREGRWLEPLLDRCGLRPDMMAEVLYAADPAGRLASTAARELGLSEDVLVAVGTNDQLVGAVGAGNVTPGCASASLGTALAIVVTSRKGVGLAGTMGFGLHAVRGLYTVLAFAKTSGIVLRWFRDNFAPALGYEEVFGEAGSVPVGSGGVTCLPHFAGTGTPTFNPAVRGAFSGLELTHTRAHLARAVVESLTFTIRENLDLLAEAAGGVSELRTIGGGARSDVWLQMIADATGVVVERPATTEAACLGAAILAMAAAGRFKSVAEGSLRLYRADRRFEPNPSLRAGYDEAFRRYRALYESLYGERKRPENEGRNACRPSRV
jgi:xylulokinase